MFRTALETLARGKYFKRRLPDEFGGAVLYVSPDAALRYLKPGAAAFDRKLLLVAKEFVRPGMVVWDIGANVGSFSFAAAALAGHGGHVLAVEADIWLADMIRKSAALPQNRHLSLDVLPAAVSDRPGVATFLIAARGRASSALEATGTRTQAGGVRERQLVPALSLDNLLEVSPPPTLVKIDVEGAELAVLTGASRLLKEVRPLLYCEVGSDENTAVTDLLKNADYLLADPAQAPEQRKALTNCPFNVLACPRERAELIGISTTDTNSL